MLQPNYKERANLVMFMLLLEVIKHELQLHCHLLFKKNNTSPWRSAIALQW